MAGLHMTTNPNCGGKNLSNCTDTKKVGEFTGAYIADGTWLRFNSGEYTMTDVCGKSVDWQIHAKENNMIYYVENKRGYLGPAFSAPSVCDGWFEVRD